MNISKKVNNDIIILAIETSCDETSCSVLRAARRDAKNTEQEGNTSEQSERPETSCSVLRAARRDAKNTEQEGNTSEQSERHETSCSILRAPHRRASSIEQESQYGKPEIRSNIIHSQIDIHRKFGGVVPEIASRNHTMAITAVVDEAVKTAGITLNDISAIGVTYGAGLLGALIVGVSYAKALSFSLNKPLIKVNHIEGHIAANFLNAEPPFICLVVSGGHTMIVKVSDYYNYEILMETVDDAAGEAFDKVARVLNLPYPGGPEIDRQALRGKDNINFFKHSRGIVCDSGFSYSGLKTAVINYLHNQAQKSEIIRPEDVCASFQKEALTPLVDSTIGLAKKHGISKITMAGGVSANSYLRKLMSSEGVKHGIDVFYPEISLCTDNAAMIALRAYYDYLEGRNTAGYDLNAVSVISSGK